MAFPETILLKGEHGRVYAEARAAGAITPGFLIEHDANGAVVAHSTAGGVAALNIALECGFQGKTIADAYASTDLVHFHRAQPGDELWMILAAPGTAGGVTPANFLESNGDGKLRKLASGVALFQSVETSSGTAEQRLRVRVP